MYPELRALVWETCPERRVELLRQISTLYLRPVANRLDAEKYLFSEIIDRIVTAISKDQKLKLVEHCDVHADLARRLARDADADVACPVIRASDLLTDDDLVDIGSSGSQEHLGAIACRREVSERVSDVLIGRGDRQVVHTLTANAGARFSSSALDRLIEKAGEDLDLCTVLVDRPDLSQATVDRLLPLASAALLIRMAERGFSVQESTPNALLRELRQHFASALRERRRHVFATHDLIGAVRSGELSIDEGVWTLVTEERLLDIATLLSASVDIERNHLFGLMAHQRTPSLLIVFRAADLEWHTVEGVLRLIGKKRGWRQESAQFRADYEAVDMATAQRSLRFFNARRAVGAAARATA